MFDLSQLLYSALSKYIQTLQVKFSLRLDASLSLTCSITQVTNFGSSQFIKILYLKENPKIYWHKIILKTI